MVTGSQREHSSTRRSHPDLRLPHTCLTTSTTPPKKKNGQSTHPHIHLHILVLRLVYSSTCPLWPYFTPGASAIPGISLLDF